MENIKEIAKFAKSFTLEQAPEEVIEKSKLLILDSLTAIIAGNQNSEIKNLTQLFTLKQSPGRELDQGLFEYMDFRKTSFINGIAMVADELDEGNPLAKGHPAAHFFPALLSLSFRHQKSGARMLEAFIVNYEISARMGSAIQQKQAIHPHGNWGLFGNGFGVGTLLNWENENEYIQGAMLGTSMAMPTLWQSILEGHNVRNVIIGLNNYHTTLLSELKQAGFTASLSTPDAIFKDVLAKDYDHIPIDFSDKYFLMNSYFKFYPYCRFCHSPVDATLQLIKKGELKMVREIRVITYAPAAELKARKVENDFAGKFSIPFAIASELYKAHFQENLFNVNKNDTIQYLMNCVTVIESKDYTNLLPEKRITTVKIVFDNGDVKSETVERATGDPDERNLKEKVINKSQTSLHSYYGSEQTDDLINLILKLENVTDMMKVQRLLETEERR